MRRKQDYEVFFAGNKHSCLQVRKLRATEEVGVVVKEKGTSSSSSLSGDYFDYEDSAEYFLTRSEAVELIKSLKEYFHI